MALRSNIYCSLEESEKKRYDEKCQNIGGRDPYVIPQEEFSDLPENFPSVAYLDIVSYLIYKKCDYTLGDFKAIKSLQAYDYFKAGWLKSLKALLVNDDTVLLLSRVLHSQRLNEVPTKTWVLCRMDGEIISAHCDCIAGLGECCSHVGATLFGVEEIVRRREAISVTDVPAYWVKPSKVGQPAPVSEIIYGEHEETNDLYISQSLSVPTASLQDGMRMLMKNPYGKWVIEVKCPFCAKDASISEMAALKSFYINPDSTGHLKLKDDHAYYYQMQMTLCEVTDCQFVVWSRNDFVIDRVSFNKEFWTSNSNKAEMFFRVVIVPEILGKLWTRAEEASKSAAST